MTNDEAHAFLAASPWMSTLTEEQRRRVTAAAQIRRFDAGTTLCARNAPALNWVGVADGMLKLETISSDGRPTTFAGVPSGAWFGEGSILKDELRPYAIVALRDSDGVRTVAGRPASAR